MPQWVNHSKASTCRSEQLTPQIAKQPANKTHLLHSTTTLAVLATFFINPARAHPLTDAIFHLRTGDIILQYKAISAFGYICDNVNFA